MDKTKLDISNQISKLYILNIPEIFAALAFNAFFHSTVYGGLSPGLGVLDHPKQRSGYDPHEQAVVTWEFGKYNTRMEGICRHSCVCIW